jgi:hypothetical protein
MGQEVKIMWDLFSGLGGASQFFDLNREWKVYRFENNYELLPYAPLNTQWRDVTEWRRWSKHYPEESSMFRVQYGLLCSCASSEKGRRRF